MGIPRQYNHRAVSAAPLPSTGHVRSTDCDIEKPLLIGRTRSHLYRSFRDVSRGEHSRAKRQRADHDRSLGLVTKTETRVLSSETTGPALPSGLEVCFRCCSPSARMSRTWMASDKRPRRESHHHEQFSEQMATLPTGSQRPCAQRPTVPATSLRCGPGPISTPRRTANQQSKQSR